MHRILVVIALVISGALSPASGCAADRTPPRSAHEAGFDYLVFETAGAGPGQTLPTIIGLHYSGAKPQAMLDYFNRIDVPARIVLPQGEYSRREGYSWYPADYARLGGADQDAVTFATERKLAVFVERIGQRYPQRGKPVVLGISYGADLGFLLAIRHPGLVGAAFPVASRYLASWIPDASTCQPGCPPIRALHGTADTTVPMEPTREAVGRLQQLGFDVSFVPYSGVAHDFDARMQEDFTEQVSQLFAAP